MIYSLPRSVEIGGKEYAINTDFRCILDIFEVLNDVELDDRERAFLALYSFYPNLEEIPVEQQQEAINKLLWFISCGDEHSKKGGKKLMDWEQDWPLIVSPVSRIVGQDVRGMEYLHWWSFMSAYMEIGECLFSQVLHVRQQKDDGKKLSKADAEWYRKNRELVDIRVQYSDAEKDLLKMWGG